MQQGISLVINTFNEEALIEDCIKSAIPFVDEIIVVDMHSSDRTVELSKALGAKVYYFEHMGIVEPARNFAIQQATYEWVLLLDADERLPNTLGNLLIETVKENSHSTVVIPRKNIQFKKWVKHTGWWPDYQVRFFKRNSIQWSNTIHFIPPVNDNHCRLPANEEYAILHYNFRSIDHLLEKICRYTAHEKKPPMEIMQNAEKFLGYFENEFNHRFIEENGYQDGIHGFMLSKFMEFYKFIQVARYWEENNYAEFTDMENIRKIILERNKHAKKKKRSLINKIFKRKKK